MLFGFYRGAALGYHYAGGMNNECLHFTRVFDWAWGFGFRALTGKGVGHTAWS